MKKNNILTIIIPANNKSPLETKNLDYDIYFYDVEKSIKECLENLSCKYVMFEKDFTDEDYLSSAVSYISDKDEDIIIFSDKVKNDIEFSKNSIRPELININDKKIYSLEFLKSLDESILNLNSSEIYILDMLSLILCKNGLASSKIDFKPYKPVNFSDCLNKIHHFSDFVISSDFPKITVNYAREIAASAIVQITEHFASGYHTAKAIELEKEIKSTLSNHYLFSNFSEEDFINKDLHEKILWWSKAPADTKQFENLPEVIISFTSFPARIGKIHKCLCTLLRQTVPADKIILWLAEEQFPGKLRDIPENLKEFFGMNFEIRWCKEDIRPHKKYFYSFKEFPESLVISVDDDLLFDADMVECLLRSYLKYPDCVSSLRTHLILPDENGEIYTYGKWIQEFSGVIGFPAMQLCTTNGAGTLFPPHCMNETMLDIEKIQSLCPRADDLWIKVMLATKGTKVVLAKANKKLRMIEDTQEFALYKTNVNQNLNDIQLKATLDFYDPQRTLTKEILSDNFDGNTFISVYNSQTDNYFKKSELVYIKGLEKDISERCQENTNLKTEVENLRKEVKALTNNVAATQKKLDASNKEKHKALTEAQTWKNRLNSVENSVSFKIGRLITIIPRKIKQFLKSFTK